LFNDAVNREDNGSYGLDDWCRLSGVGGKWNDTDRGTPKYTENIQQLPTLSSPQIPHGRAWDRTQQDRRLT